MSRPSLVLIVATALGSMSGFILGCSDDTVPGTDGSSDLPDGARPTSGRPDLTNLHDFSGPDLQRLPTTTIAAARMMNVATPIEVLAVVTAVRGSDPVATVEWYIEDPGGGPYSGVDVFCNRTAKNNPCPMSVAPPALHDYLYVRGTLGTVRGKVILSPIESFTARPFHPLPPLDAVNIAELDPAAASSYRGVLLRVRADTLTVDSVTPTVLYNAACNKLDGGNGSPDGGMPLCKGCNPPTYSGFQVTDGNSAELLVQNGFPLAAHLQSSPECQLQFGSVKLTVGVTFSFMSGIFDFDPSSMSQVLMPTADTDYRTP